jgi:hypothetical protein
MTKPYAVGVVIGEKKTVKEFDTENEFKMFLLKAEELKKKAPTLLVKILRKPKPAPTPVKKRVEKEIINDPREDSLCWKPVIKDGIRMRDSWGRLLYQCIQAPFKSQKVLYCPYCNAYKEWGTVDLRNGLKEKGCTDCGMTKNDFFIKTANGLWKVK